MRYFYGMELRIGDLFFEPLISSAAIQQRIAGVAQQINNDYEDRSPLMVGVLNGSFMFMADLAREITVPCNFTFTKVASYFGGTASSRTIREDFEVSIDVEGRDVLLVEDIIDTGNTIRYLIDRLQARNPASIAVCTLLLKPEALEHQIPEIKYVAFEIANEFVVGYGLDYNELGRNLNGIYRKV